MDKEELMKCVGLFGLLKRQVLMVNTQDIDKACTHAYSLELDIRGNYFHKNKHGDEKQYKGITNEDVDKGKSKLPLSAQKKS